MSFWTRSSIIISLALFLSPFADGQADVTAAAPAATPTPAASSTSKAAPSPTPNDCISVSPSMKKDCDLHATITEIVAPDSPAFTLLGINPSNVSKPTTPAEFATDVINAFDDNGHFQSGAALDVVPYLVFAGRSPALGKLVPVGKEKWTSAQQLHGYVNRVLTRTSVSFATIKGTSNPDTSVRMATGLRAALLDKGDPRTNFQSCAAQIDIALNPDDPDNAKIAADIKKAITDCRNKAKRAWNATSFTIAGASSWISTDGSTSNMMRNGGGFWASFALGFSDWGQLIVNGRRVTGEQVVPPNTPASTSGTSAAFVLQDTSIGGGAFRVGRSDFNAIVEGLYIGKRTGGVVDSYPEFGFGVEKKLAEKVYLELNYRYDVNSKSNTSGVLANLKWSFSQEPKIATAKH
jgi:hypothetical protein